MKMRIPPLRAEEMLDQLDTWLSEAPAHEATLLMEVLTALRGPDSDYPLKYETTSKVRFLAMPKVGAQLDVKTGYSIRECKLEDLPNPEALAKFGLPSPHFLQHYAYAKSALEQIYARRAMVAGTLPVGEEQL